MTQQIVGASIRVQVENEAAVRMKEEMLARQRAIEEDRARMQSIAAEKRRLEELRLEEEEARERKRRQEEEEARLTREREAERFRLEAEEAERIRREAEAAERLRLEAEAERMRLEREAEAQRKAEEEAERKRLEQERREQWEREERERQERWERDEAERIRWLLNEKQRMEDERMVQMEAMKEEMRMELRMQKAELEAAAAAVQLEAEDAVKKRERELQEQRDGELAKRLAEETQDPPLAPAPATPVTRHAVDAGPVRENGPLPSYEELNSAQLAPPVSIYHSPSPRSRLMPLPPSPPMFSAPQLPYHEPLQPPPMGTLPGPSSREGARTPVPRSPMRQPIELPPDNPVFRTLSPPINGHVHGSESFDHSHAHHRPPMSNPGLNRHTVSLGGANPGRAPPPPRFSMHGNGFNPHQPHTSPPMPTPHLNPDEGLPGGARQPIVHGALWAVPNASSSSAGPSQPLHLSAIQASGSGSRPAHSHYGDPPPDGVSGVCE
jgi:hypothetical protein